MNLGHRQQRLEYGFEFMEEVRRYPDGIQRIKFKLLLPRMLRRRHGTRKAKLRRARRWKRATYYNNHGGTEA